MAVVKVSMAAVGRWAVKDAAVSERLAAGAVDIGGRGVHAGSRGWRKWWVGGGRGGGGGG